VTTWTPDQIALTLDKIARCPAEELRRWHACVTRRSPFSACHRDPMPGEMAALYERARIMGVGLSSSPAGPSG